MAKKAVLLSSLLSIREVVGHSWLHCTAYTATITGQDYDDSNCEGFIRSWQNSWNAPGFSQDLGINYFGSDGAWCQTAFSSDIESMYTESYPYADWYAGETYRLVWPAKNHANYDCFANIPDTSMKLYYNPTVDPTTEATTLGSDWIVLHDFQDGCTAGTDGCGFQNCPKFCEDTDGAPCYGDYTVDGDMFSSEGFYSIMWYWIFNPGSPYVTCFEVYVHRDGNAPTPPPTTPSPTTESEEFETTTTTEEGGNGGGSGGTPDYIVQIPVCYSGASYNEDTLEDGANDAFDDDDEIDFSVISYVIRDSTLNIWNATIQTSTHDSILVTDSALNDDEELCDAIEDAFGTGSCDICDEGAIRVFYASSSGGGNSNNSGGGGSSSDDSDGAVTILWAIVLTIVILLLIFGLCYFLRSKGYIVCTNNSISWQGSGGGASSAQTAATINNGATTTGAGGSGLSAQGQQTHQVVPHGARPPRPPPPRPVH